MPNNRVALMTALLGAAGLFCSFTAFAAATTGSCQTKAVSLSAGTSKTVQLQDEWDADWNENTGSPVYWFKFTASQGKDYTFFTTGASAELQLWVGAANWEKDYLNIDYGTAKDGKNVRATFRYDPNWWESGSSCTYYICVTGFYDDITPIGSTISASLAAGMLQDDSAPIGSMEKPATLNAEAEGVLQGSYLSTPDDNGRYTYIAQMQGGKKYYLQVSSAGDDTTAGNFEIGFRKYDDNFEEYALETVDASLLQDISDPDKRFVKYIFTPASNATYCVQLSGMPDEQFSFKVEFTPRLAISEHPLNSAVNAGSVPVSLDERIAQDVKCTPKTRKFPADSIYDDAIIDMELYGFKLAKNNRYVFWTESSGLLASDLVMELYDSKGKCIASNTCCTATDKNVAIGFSPTADETYYIGIAQTGVETPVDLTLTFKAAEIGAASAADSDFVDQFDFADSNYLHSAVLSFEADSSVTSAPHAFSRTDWEDWVRVDARNGVTYSIKAQSADGWVEPTPGLSLVADVYTLGSTALSVVKDASGKQMTGLDPYVGFALPTGANASYYIKFSVRNGQGLRYGPYSIVTSADAPGGVGVLKVHLVGPEKGAFQIDGDPSPAPSYFSGEELLLPNGDTKLKFVAVADYSAPLADTVSVPGEYTYKYKDTFDPKDDDSAGATQLNISQTAIAAKRTLVDSDPRDMFKFTEYGAGAIVKRYKFALDPCVGDAVFSVTNAERGVAANGVKAVANLALGASMTPWYVVVTHSGVPAEDSSYSLRTIAYTATTFSPTTSTSPQSLSVSPVDGEAYLAANLEAGRKYSFSYTGSAKLEIEGEGERIGDEKAFSYYPSVSGMTAFRFTDADGSFTFKHNAAAARSVAQHIKTGALVAGKSSVVKPGRVNSWTSTNSDSIPDECLYTVNLERGKSYLITATGATTNIVLRVYDPQGNFVTESYTDGVAGSLNVRALVEQASAGVYCVGLAQVFDEKHVELVPVPNMQVRLLISEASQEDEAVALEVKPNVWTDVPQEGFDSNRWTRTYTVAARKDVVYRFRTAAAAETPFAVAMRAYRRQSPASTYETALQTGEWTGVPAADGAYELKANANATYYVELSATNAEARASAKGCYHPAFTLSHEAVGKTGNLGVLKVDVRGAAGQWYLGTDQSAKYDGGASVLVAGDQKVSFTMVTGFATPAATNVSVKAWTKEGDETTALGVYTDTYDPRDNTAAGASMLSVSTMEGRAARTLFAKDPEDNFAFNAMATYIYAFRLEQPEDGDAVFSVSNRAGAVVGPTNMVEDLSLVAGQHWLTVRHAGSPKDDTTDSYTLVSVAYMPTSVTPGTYNGQAQGRPAGGACYFTAKLKGGSKYMFALSDPAATLEKWTVGGSGWREKNPDATFAGVSGGAYGGFAVYPDSDDTYVFKVRSKLASVALHHRMAGTRTVSQHTVSGTLAVGVAVDDAKPGYVNAEATGCQDGIIDDCLYKVNLAMGKKYLVLTEGSETNLLLRVYDMQGAVVAESRTDGVPGSYDVRALVEPKSAGTFYVGLAQDGLDEIEYTGAKPSAEVSLSVVEASQEDEAVALEVKPNVWTDVPQEGFDSNRWTRTYTVAARKDVVYRFRTAAAAETPFAVAMRAYRRQSPASTYETALQTGEWTGVPAADGAYELKANANATYYVELSATNAEARASAKGCYHPAFTLSHEAVGKTGNLGVLKVDVRGAAGQWYLGTDQSAKYDGGASVLVAGDQKVSFTMVTGFATPAATNVSVKAWTKEGDETTALGVYTDTYDPRDNTAAGASMLTVSAKTQTVARTLWSPSDPEDWFSVYASKGVYYDFTAVSTTGAAAPLVEVYKADGVTKVKDAASMVRFAADANANYRIRVIPSGGEGTAYELSYSSRNAGTVSLDKNAYTVSSTAGTLEVKVSRTSSIGVLRVKYSTLGVSNAVGRAYGATAEAGVNYDTVGGTLEWAAGDMSAKSVKVPILAELYGRYRGDKTLFFEIRVVPGTGSDAGYDPVVVNSPTEITIKDAARPANGTVGITGYDIGAGRKSLSAYGAATVAAKAGDMLTLYVSRTGGADGMVGATLETAAGASPSGAWPVISTNIVWNNWEYGDKAVTLEIPARAEPMGDKTFGVALAALTGDDFVAPAIGRKSLDVKVSDVSGTSTFVLAKNPIPVDQYGLVSVSVPDTGTKLAWSGAAGRKYRVMLGKDRSALGKGADLADAIAGADGYTVYGLESGSTYYWRVDTLEMDGDTVIRALTNAVWSFKAEAGIPQTIVTSTSGDTVYANGDTVELAQAQSVSMPLGSSEALPGTVRFAVVGGALPAGLSLTTSGAAMIKGVPTKPGEYVASLQAAGTGRSAETITLKFNVKSAGVAVGTFNGILRRVLETNLVDRLGHVTTTVTADGRISATATVGQKTWRFSGNGFDEYYPDGVAPVFSTELRSVSGVVTNTLTMTIPAGDTNSLAAISTPAVFDLSAAGNDETASGLGYRASSDLPVGKEALGDFAGYYTVSLPATMTEYGVPSGAGYVTATIDAAGAVRVAGVLGDGSMLTLSTSAAIMNEDADAILLPIYSGAATRSFGGVLVLRKQDGRIVADSTESLEWNESDAKKTYDSDEGFALQLVTVGGVYDTLVNLQTYYLDREISFEAGAFADALPDEIHPAGFDSLLLYPGAGSEDDILVTFTGNGIAVAPKSLKYDANRLVDFYESTNASGVSAAFTRSTGLFSGSFSLWFGDNGVGKETKQRELTGFRYNGVMTPVKDSREILFADYPGMGYMTSLVGTSSRMWTGSWFIGLVETDKSNENAEMRRKEGSVLDE